ncbi:SGNH hydrolase domain-containing protein [Luteibacter sp.]|uniref:SGNH hydrolase domain-containing protein n=1 Tax=Luteibacter sp. TaxID=1886636 RepID=UPI0039C9DCF6
MARREPRPARYCDVCRRTFATCVTQLRISQDALIALAVVAIPGDIPVPARAALVLRPCFSSTAHGAADLTATVNQLSSHVRRVVVIGATPDLRACVPDCLSRNSLKSCEVTRRECIAQSAAIRTLLSSLLAKYPNVTYVEPIDFFCTQESCPGVRNGMALYWDSNHVSASAAAVFGREFVAGHTK